MSCLPKTPSTCGNLVFKVGLRTSCTGIYCGRRPRINDSDTMRMRMTDMIGHINDVQAR